MNRFLVESNHTAQDCHHVVEQFIAYGHVISFDWGCEVGAHTGWAMVEAEDESQALLSVPAILRSKARAVRLVKYTPESIEAKHK